MFSVKPFKEGRKEILRGGSHDNTITRRIGSGYGWSLWIPKFHAPNAKVIHRNATWKIICHVCPTRINGVRREPRFYYVFVYLDVCLCLKVKQGRALRVFKRNVTFGKWWQEPSPCRLGNTYEFRLRVWNFPELPYYTGAFSFCTIVAELDKAEKISEEDVPHLLSRGRFHHKPTEVTRDHTLMSVYTPSHPPTTSQISMRRHMSWSLLHTNQALLYTLIDFSFGLAFHGNNHPAKYLLV